MAGSDDLLDHLDALLADVDAAPEPLRSKVFELLDGVDALHREALIRLGALLGAPQLARLRAADPTVAWLLDAYRVGMDERAAAEAAIDRVRPYLHGHGGDVTVTAARDGIVRVRLTGACSGCTASMVTLRHGVEEALRDGFAGFVALEVDEDGDAAAHPPPGPTLLQIESLLPPAESA